jgi:hypothetical protein
LTIVVFSTSTNWIMQASATITPTGTRGFEAAGAVSISFWLAMTNRSSGGLHDVGQTGCIEAAIGNPVVGRATGPSEPAPVIRAAGGRGRSASRDVDP